MQEFRCGGTHLQNFPHALQRMVRTVAPCVGRTLRGVQGPFGLDTFMLETLASSYRCEERFLEVRRDTHDDKVAESRHPRPATHP